MPLDVLRELEKAGEFGKLYDSFFTTTGTGTATGSAAKFGEPLSDYYLKVLHYRDTGELPFAIVDAEDE